LIQCRTDFKKHKKNHEVLKNIIKDLGDLKNSEFEHEANGLKGECFYEMGEY